MLENTRRIHKILLTYCKFSSGEETVGSANLPKFICKYRYLFFRYSIMLKCWHENPDMRPTFETLEHKIRHFLKLSVKQEDSYKQEPGSDAYSKPNCETIDYVRLSNYGNEHGLETESDFPCPVDSCLDMNTSTGSTTTTVSDVGHLLEFNESTDAALSDVVDFNSKDNNHSSACSVSEDTCHNTPSNNVRTYPVDEVTSEYTRL